jgi:hypothetical protein
LNHEKLTKMFYTEFETQEGQRILPHPAWNNNNNAIIHATSKTPFMLQPSQKIEIPMPSLITPHSSRPASIITKNPKIIKTFFLKYKIISLYELLSITHSYPDLFHLDAMDRNYMHEKNFVLCELLTKHLSPHGNWEDIFLKELRANCYSNALLNSAHSDIIQAIKEFKDQSNL